MKIVRIHMHQHKRKVDNRGRVTIPKDIRERKGISGGDEIEFVEVDGKILIKPLTDEKLLAEGYQKRAERSKELAKEIAVASSEAIEQTEDAPGWSE